jgi:hypothetical protein
MIFKRKHIKWKKSSGLFEKFAFYRDVTLTLKKSGPLSNIVKCKELDFSITYDSNSDFKQISNLVKTKIDLLLNENNN